MPELRKDPVIGRWVIIATERARRPGNFVNEQDKYFLKDKKYCLHCQWKEIPLYAIKENGRPASSRNWKVCAVQASSPFLKMENIFDRQRKGLYDVINGYGRHEVVIETSDHVANMADLTTEQIILVLKTYRVRLIECKNDPHLQYVIIYKNYGWQAGAHSQGHALSHMIATPVNPLRVKEKLAGARSYFKNEKRCIFCDLIREELQSRQRIVEESEHFLAITPFAARFLFEVWLLPKSHHCDYIEGIEGKEKDLAEILRNLLRKFKVGLDDPAYNFMIHTAPLHRYDPNGQKWQTIEQDYHWHMELMPRLTRVAGFEKGTGFYICSIPPEMTAEYLREIKDV